MNANHDLERRIADYYATEAPRRAPDRVLASVLTTIETTPQRRVLWHGPRRFQSMNPFSKVAVAGVAIVAVTAAVVALGVPWRSNVGDGPTPSASGSLEPSRSPSPSPDPTAIPLPDGGALEEGRYVADVVESDVSVELTIAEPGWAGHRWFLSDGLRSLSFWSIGNVYANACDPASLLDPPIGPTVDEFMAALDSQVATDMQSPANATVDGYNARTGLMRPSTEGNDCPGMPLRLWSLPGGGDGRSIVNEGPVSRPDTVWAVDVEGTRVIIVGWFDETSPDEADSVLEMVDSIDFIVP